MSFAGNFLAPHLKKTIPKENFGKESETEEEKMPITVKEHIRERKSKSKRDDLYANLPVRVVKLPLTEAQRRCEYCNSEMITFTHTVVREEIQITPAKVERIRLMQEVAICPECKKDRDGTVVKAAVYRHYCHTAQHQHHLLSTSFLTNVLWGFPITDKNPAWRSWDSSFQERPWRTGSFTAQSITSIRFMKGCMNT